MPPGVKFTPRQPGRPVKMQPSPQPRTEVGQVLPFRSDANPASNRAPRPEVPVGAMLCKLQKEYEESEIGHRAQLYEFLMGALRVVRYSDRSATSWDAVQKTCGPLMGGDFNKEQASFAIVVFMMNAQTPALRKLASKYAQAISELWRGRPTRPQALERLTREGIEKLAALDTAWRRGQEAPVEKAEADSGKPEAIVSLHCTKAEQEIFLGAVHKGVQMQFELVKHTSKGLVLQLTEVQTIVSPRVV